MALHFAQVTIGAAATQLSATRKPVKWLCIQNNSTHNFRLGDSTVSSTKGIALATGSPGGSLTLTADTAYNTDLSQWWVFGTQNDLVDILWLA